MVRTAKEIQKQIDKLEAECRTVAAREPRRGDKLAVARIEGMIDALRWALRHWG